MSSKRYYWLKLKENFFKQKSIKKLRKIAGGDTYTIIYLKLMLLSMQTDGCVYFEGIEDNFEEELALELDEQVDNVKVTLSYLERHGLLETGDENSFVLPETLSCIGSEGDSAARVRKHRELKALQDNEVPLLGNDSVTSGNTEIEKEIDIEVEREKDKPTTKPAVTKIKYADYVAMTEDEYEKLLDQFGKNAANEMIEILDNYKGSKGRTYKNDYRAILSWVVKRWKEEHPGVKDPKNPLGVTR